MPDFSDFKGRLLFAMENAKVDKHALRNVLGVSIQAINKLIGPGTSKKMEAGNNIKAAEALGVDPLWLATGEGKPFSLRVWPFQRLKPEDWARISPELRKGAEDMLMAARETSEGVGNLFAADDEGKTVLSRKPRKSAN